MVGTRLMPNVVEHLVLWTLETAPGVESHLPTTYEERQKH